MSAMPFGYDRMPDGPLGPIALVDTISNRTNQDALTYCPVNQPPGPVSTVAHQDPALPPDIATNFDVKPVVVRTTDIIGR